MTGTKFFIASGITEGQEVRLARTLAGKTQWEIAQKAGLPQWAVSAVERADRYVPPSWRRKIRAALGLDGVEASNA